MVGDDEIKWELGGCHRLWILSHVIWKAIKEFQVGEWPDSYDFERVLHCALEEGGLRSRKEAER